MTNEEFRNHLQSAEDNPNDVSAAVAGLSDAALRYKPAPNKWCILEILGHLADVEIVYGHRLRQMIAQKDSVISPMEQDDWARHLGYMEASPAELLEIYKLNRRANMRLLRRLRPEELKKADFHPEFNRNFTLAELIERLAAHGPNHLGQIERLKLQAKASA